MVLRERIVLRGRSTGKGAADRTSYVNFRARLVRVHLAERLIPTRRRPEFLIGLRLIFFSLRAT